MQSPSQSPSPSPARARIDTSLAQIRSSRVVYQAFRNYRSQRKEAKLLHRKATPVFSQLQRVITIPRTRPSHSPTTKRMKSILPTQPKEERKGKKQKLDQGTSQVRLHPWEGGPRGEHDYHFALPALLHWLSSKQG